MTFEVVQHVLFDGEPRVVCHVCRMHRQIADTLVCCQEQQDGECAHVQYRACDCAETHGCSLCPEDAA